LTTGSDWRAAYRDKDRRGRVLFCFRGVRFWSEGDNCCGQGPLWDIRRRRNAGCRRDVRRVPGENIFTRTPMSMRRPKKKGTGPPPVRRHAAGAGFGPVRRRCLFCKPSTRRKGNIAVTMTPARRQLLNEGRRGNGLQTGSRASESERWCAFGISNPRPKTQLEEREGHRGRGDKSAVLTAMPRN